MLLLFGPSFVPKICYIDFPVEQSLRNPGRMKLITFAIVSAPCPLALATESFRQFIECARAPIKTTGQLTIMLRRKINFF